MNKKYKNSKNLDFLLKGIYEGREDLKKFSINGLTLDSRKVKKGFLFVALKGSKLDGNEYVNEGIQNGAEAVLTDNPKLHENNILYVKNLKKELGRISSRFYDHPSSKLMTFCVTGTNGKTSCVETLSQLASLKGLSCGYISTIGISLDGINLKQPSSLTTPDSISLQDAFSKMIREDIKLCAFEASSHGLDQYRVDGTEIDTAILTSFSQDHLDYHNNIEEYKEAKKRLFYELKPKNVILNIDNVLGQEIYDSLIKNNINDSKIFTVAAGKNADFSYDFNRDDQGLLNVTLNALGEDIRFSLNTISRPLASNLISAMASLIVKGFNFSNVDHLFKDLKFPLGRMEEIPSNQADKYFVDYAHTPEALEHSLIEIRDAFEKKEIWCVFGCGGDRDKSKRSLMGNMAFKFSDRVIVTNDNPREESEMSIIKEIISGFEKSPKLKVIVNRKDAISFCLEEMSNKEDECVLLVAGKGHEDYQEISNERFYFNDSEEIKKYLENMN